MMSEPKGRIIRGKLSGESHPASVSEKRSPLRMRRVWLLSFALWSIPALAFSVLIALAPDSERRGASFLQLFLHQGLPWYYWAFLTPLILSRTTRLPLDRAPRGRTFALHAVMGILAGFYFYLVWMSIAAFAPAVPGSFHAPRYQDMIVGLALLVPFSMGIYATTAAVGYAMDFYRRLRERELMASRLQSQLDQAQLGALRMQLQPHFLFNTLNTIAMLVREGETQTSVRMLARLSDLLRHLLEDEGAQEVPLREELDFLSRYLEIEQLRFHDRLRVSVIVEEGTRDAFVPNLLLQPIVENAIRHGISQRAAASEIELNVARVNGSLHVTVRDDGPGLSPAFSMHNITGIGLRNTAARLEALYGSAGTLDVRNAPDNGTIVTLELPFHETPVTDAGESNG